MPTIAAIATGFVLGRVHAEWSRRRMLHRLIREQDAASMEEF